MKSTSTKKPAKSSTAKRTAATRKQAVGSQSTPFADGASDSTSRPRGCRRFKIVLVNRPIGWKPTGWKDVPPGELETIRVLSEMPDAGVDGFLFGFNGGALKNRKDTTWAVAIELTTTVLLFESRSAVAQYTADTAHEARAFAEEFTRLQMSGRGLVAAVMPAGWMQKSEAPLFSRELLLSAAGSPTAAAS